MERGGSRLGLFVGLVNWLEGAGVVGGVRVDGWDVWLDRWDVMLCGWDGCVEGCGVSGWMVCGWLDGGVGEGGCV